ncbi:hypothetical protein GCM10011351_30510 [Paraliobacillus quinghaiensis]|uniref:Uncharacterized protein n=1 Tax=Paraliobacillus quinghaiensis TaxID=470815 RepID=A0A917TX30_9BACI|nr:hypothetical protein [Paraliobacillus quinghaiensis]GGM42367.1 hypothetical protein GCM10011351_30510 [Paraliobacillus quinghaiensis]
MTILMGMAVYPPEGKPYALMVADSMSSQLVYSYNQHSGEHEVSGTEYKENVKKLHRFNDNFIIGFEGMLVGDIHHKTIDRLHGLIDPGEDLNAIHKKVVDLIVDTFPEGSSLDAQYSVIMCGFIEGIPSLNQTIFRNNKIIQSIIQKPNKASFKPIFDPQTTVEMIDRFRSKVLQYDSKNLSLFRKALVELAKDTSKLSTGSNDKIKVERLR